MTDTPKPKKLTIKQKKFVKGIAQGKSATVSAQDSYDVKNYQTAAAIASENLNKPYVKEAVEAEMIKQGITMEQIIAPVSKALKATHIYKDNEGVPLDTGVPDLEMQLKGHDRAVKLMMMGQKQEQPSSSNIFVNGNANFNSGKYTD